MMHGAILGNPSAIERVYARGRLDKISQHVHLYEHIISSKNLDEHLSHLSDIEVIFSTWGMPSLSKPDLDRLPKLKAVFYAAGSVQSFAQPLLERGITVVSAWRANAIPVAEFTMAQILLANKGVFRCQRLIRSLQDYRHPFRAKGNFGSTVALLGAGAIGKRVIDLLKPFHLRVVVFDPYLSEKQAGELGVAKVSLEEAFSMGNVVSNHLANLPQTVGMLRRDLFERMPLDATFINTGRGATVDEPGLIEVLTRRMDLTALLDVTHPEPPEAGSLLYQLPNVFLTPHIAGSIGDEVLRMADFVIEEFNRWVNQQPLLHAVSMEMLATMA